MGVPTDIVECKRAPVLEETGHRIGHNPETSSEQEEAKSLKTVGGPARIRTWDRRIMSPLL